MRVPHVAWLLSSPAQRPQPGQITPNEGFLLFSRPSLDLTFAANCGESRWVGFRVDKLYRTALEGEGGTSPGVVVVESGCKARCLADVQAAVGAAQDVDVVHGWIPSRRAGPALRCARYARLLRPPSDSLPCHDCEWPAMSERVLRVSAARASRMVEAAGIEPASEKVRTRASTRLAVSFFYLAGRPLSGK